MTDDIKEELEHISSTIAQLHGDYSYIDNDEIIRIRKSINDIEYKIDKVVDALECIDFDLSVIVALKLKERKLLTTTGERNLEAAASLIVDSIKR